MLRLEARGIDENELGVRARHDSVDAVASGLRLAGRYRHPRTDQPVDERRLADVRTADDRDQAAPKVAVLRLSHGPRVPSCSTAAAYARSAAACSATRRLGPLPVAAIPSAGTRHSTVNVCACASPASAVTAYSGTGIRRACSHSCNRVFASFASA